MICADCNRIYPSEVPVLYTMKQQAVSFVSRNLCDHLTYTVRNGPLRGMKRKGGLGWLPVEHGLTPEQSFLANLNLSGCVVYDIGGFEGLMTLLFAKLGASRIICYEPNSRNRARLHDNIKINALQNVTVRNVGLGESVRTANISWSPNLPGTASAEGNGSKNEKIRIVTLDADRAENLLPAPNFIKIDIEGQELHALQGAKETLAAYPHLYLEMHGKTMSKKQLKVAEIVKFLSNVGYSNFLHIESNTRITADNSSVAAEGHLFVSASISTNRTLY